MKTYIYSFISVILLWSFLLSEIKIGDEAPTFYVRTLDERDFFLSDSLKKNQRPIVFSFFATWCIPCRKEIPVLDSIRTIYPKVDFYLIDVSGLTKDGKMKIEDPVNVRKMIKSLGTEIPVLMDKFGTVAEKYDAVILPRIIAIAPTDSSFKVVYERTGYERGDEKKLIETIESLLEK